MTLSHWSVFMFILPALIALIIVPLALVLMWRHQHFQPYSPPEEVEHLPPSRGPQPTGKRRKLRNLPEEI
jgi:hypothetical protein